MNEETKKEIMGLALKISELLKNSANPHIKVEIMIDSIKQTSIDWSEPTDEWN